MEDTEGDEEKEDIESVHNNKQQNRKDENQMIQKKVCRHGELNDCDIKIKSLEKKYEKTQEKLDEQENKVNLTKTCKQIKKYDTDEELKDEIEVINDICSLVTNVLLCRLCEAYGQLSKNLEDTDQSLNELCIMHSELKEHFKIREKKWAQTVTELIEKHKPLENDYDKEINEPRLSNNQDVSKTAPNVINNMIENMPQLLLNDIMNDQRSDESSSSIELSGDFEIMSFSDDSRNY